MPHLPRSPRRFLFLSLAALLTLAACSRPDSILLVEVATLGEIHPTQFRVTVTTGLDSRVIAVPPDPGVPMTLPISFTVELDRSRAAPVTVSIEAFDDTQSVIGCGSTVQEHIQIGGQTVMTVWMDPTCGGGAGGSGGSGGAGGSGGTGGEGGSGGSGGADLDAASD